LLKGFLTQNLVNKESSRSPNEVLDLLNFHETAAKSNDEETRVADKAVTKAKRALQAAEKAHREVAMGDGARGTKETSSTRDVR